MKAAANGAPGFSAPTKRATAARNSAGSSVMDSATKNIVPRSQRAFGKSNTLSCSIPAYPGSLWQASRSCLRGSPISL